MVKEINFENNVPETEKEGQKVESASGARLARNFTTPQTAEETNSAEEEKQEEDLELHLWRSKNP